MSPRVLGVIPARWGSSRFPGKPLADLGGRPVLEWVWRRARKARRLDEVLVATDDERIVRAVADFGGDSVLTEAGIATGTERVAAAAAGREAGIVLNIQGDEPFIAPGMIDAAVVALLREPAASVSTLVRRTRDRARIADPNRVKVTMDLSGRALYFSRAPIPYDRDAPGSGEAWEHIGLYCYRRDFLELFTRLAPTPLENREKLEQLRVLERGYIIQTVEVEGETLGIDTPQDLETARRLLALNPELMD